MCVQGALPGLVAILKRFVPYPIQPSSGASTVRRAADAITNLAHENVSIKSRVRTEGGIPPLVALLGSYDAKVLGPALHTPTPHDLGNFSSAALLLAASGAQTSAIGITSTTLQCRGCLGSCKCCDISLHKQAQFSAGRVWPPAHHFSICLLTSRNPSNPRHANHAKLGNAYAVMDSQVQRAAAGALRTLAFKNEDNKNQIVECGALPTLIQMLQADDAGIHYEAVGVIGNLVHSSIHIKRQVGTSAMVVPRSVDNLYSLGFTGTKLSHA